MRREVIREEILFTVNVIVVKSVHEPLLKNLNANLETSMKIAFADYTEPSFEPANLSAPERRISISALQTKCKNCTKT